MGIDHNDIWHLTADEAINAHIATGYPQEAEVATQILSADQTEKFKSQLAAIPIYAAIQSQLPDDYQKIEAILVDGVQRGHTLAQIRELTQPIVVNSYQKALPTADATAINDFYRMMVDEGKEIRTTQGDGACEAYYNGNLKSFNYSALPVALKDRELEVGARLISTRGSRHPKVLQISDIQTYLNIAVQKASLASGVSDQQLTDALQSKLPAGQNCKPTLAFFEAVLSLGNPGSGMLLDYMAQNASP